MGKDGRGDDNGGHDQLRIQPSTFGMLASYPEIRESLSIARASGSIDAGKVHRSFALLRMTALFMREFLGQDTGLRSSGSRELTFHATRTLFTDPVQHKSVQRQQ